MEALPPHFLPGPTWGPAACVMAQFWRRTASGICNCVHYMIEFLRPLSVRGGRAAMRGTVNHGGDMRPEQFTGVTAPAIPSYRGGAAERTALQLPLYAVHTPGGHA